MDTSSVGCFFFPFSLIMSLMERGYEWDEHNNFFMIFLLIVIGCFFLFFFLRLVTCTSKEALVFLLLGCCDSVNVWHMSLDVYLDVSSPNIFRFSL